MNKNILLAGCLMATSFAAIADDHSTDAGPDRRFYVSALANYNYFDSNVATEDAAGLSLIIGKPIFSWLDVEGQIFKADAKDNANNDLDVQGYGVAARFYPGRYTMPFYALAAYSVGDDQTAGNGDTDFFDLGVGYTHAITAGGTSLRAEYRARRGETEGAADETMTHVVGLGIEIPLGAARPLNARETGVPTYRNTKVTDRRASGDWNVYAPCIDSDADGVCDFGDQCPNTPVGSVVNGQGCVTKAGPSVHMPTAGAPFILEGVEFEFDSSQLTTTSYPILDRAAEVLLQHRGIPIEIAGHTDDWGSYSYNINLSNARAASVRDYLISKGVSATRLSSQGYGEADPIQPNSNPDGSDNAEGRARNRRVELRRTDEQ